MLPYYVEHYSKFVDKITIIDNDSSDGTPDLAKELGCEVKHYHTNGQQDNIVMAHVKNNCWKGSKADWVIVGDIDEMLWDWEKIENYVPSNLVIKPIGYNMVGEIDLQNDTIWSIKKGHRNKGFDKMILFNPTIEEIGYLVGCHQAQPKGAKVIKTDIRLLHFNNINEQYLVDKHHKYRNRISQSDLEKNFGTFYLNPDEKVRKSHQDALKILENEEPII